MTSIKLKFKSKVFLARELLKLMNQFFDIFKVLTVELRGQIVRRESIVKAHESAKRPHRICSLVYENR